jgi:hypothetical protein
VGCFLSFSAGCLVRSGQAGTPLERTDADARARHCYFLFCCSLVEVGVGGGGDVYDLWVL